MSSLAQKLNGAGNPATAGPGNRAAPDSRSVSHDNLTRAVVDQAHDIIIITEAGPLDPPGPRIIYVNRAFEQATGYSAEEIVGKTPALMHGALTSTQTLAGIYESLKTRRHARAELVKYTKDGRERWLEIDVRPITDAQGAVIQWVRTERDITRRKNAEASLTAEKDRLAVTLRSIGEGVISTDAEGRVLLINRIAESICGWRQENALGKKPSDIVKFVQTKESLPLEDPLEKVLKSGLPVSSNNNTSLITDCKECKNVAYNASPIFDNTNNIVGGVLVLRDITEQVKNEAELLRFQKLDSLSILAGGIAHDFNNLLTGIIGNLSLARNCVNPKESVFSILKMASNAALRAKSLTQQLQTFAQGGTALKSKASVSDILHESGGFILSGTTSRCDISIAENLWPVEVDQGQISQVFNNLLINASHAMPDGGIIYLNAENVEYTGDPPLPMDTGRYVRIHVRDEGVGISSEDLPKIFDPYFTTKDDGSGLGLASTYSIIKNHDGHICVESEPGKGTQFTIYLPATEEAESPTHMSEPEKIIHRGQGKVLIMDDEQLIQQITGDMLTHLGYEVGFASDGNEAIELYSEALKNKNPFSIVIMDLTITAGPGARETIKELLKLDPEARAIVTSGYGGDALMTTPQLFGFKCSVLKPYNLQQLSQVLKNACEA